MNGVASHWRWTETVSIGNRQSGPHLTPPWNNKHNEEEEKEWESDWEVLAKKKKKKKKSFWQSLWWPALKTKHESFSGKSLHLYNHSATIKWKTVSFYTFLVLSWVFSCGASLLLLLICFPFLYLYTTLTTSTPPSVLARLCLFSLLFWTRAHTHTPCKHFPHFGSLPNFLLSQDMSGWLEIHNTTLQLTKVFFSPTRRWGRQGGGGVPGLNGTVIIFSSNCAG